jgi:peptidoglycan L-alanyl-D-glutamate endopeptidase CwlK
LVLLVGKRLEGFEMINSRDIHALNPRTSAKALDFQVRCANAGIDIIFTSTFRDDESQNSLYAQGRTTPGKRVTNVAGGGSFHNWRVAFDFVPIVNGKAIWDDNDLWERCGVIGEQCGLEWGGRWKKFVDRPHMQDTMGFSIAQYQRGEVKV